MTSATSREETLAVVTARGTLTCVGSGGQPLAGEWGEVHSLAIGPTLSSDEALRLVEQRLALK